MNQQSEQFRHKALECERLAGATPNDFIASEYLSLAEQWRELADQVERHRLLRR